MKSFWMAGWILLALLLGALPARGQELARVFPLDEGWSWTYRMTVEVGGKRRAIEYTTKVVRTEQVAEVGPCAVLESRSDKKLIQVEWYCAEETQIVNPQRQDGARAPIKAFAPRVFLDGDALRRLESSGEAQPSWEWQADDESAQGTLTLTGKERVKAGQLGFFDCYVLVDAGTYSVGGQTRAQERRIWLAEDVGVVKEVMTVKKPNGEVTIRTEAELKRYEKP